MINFTFGLIVSIIYSYLILPKKEGAEPFFNCSIYPILHKGMIIIPYNSEKAIHIHHWIICLLFCLLRVFYTIPELILGISFGLFIQGIQYKDCFDFICDNPYLL